MPVQPTLAQATLLATLAIAALSACRQQTPPSPQTGSDTPTQVAPSTDLRGASDDKDAPPAVGAMTAGQASGGARSGPVQPTAGDRASAPASGASS